MIASALSPQQTFAQNNGNNNNNYNYGQRWLDYDTIWGNGLFVTNKADGSPLGNVQLYLTPDTMQMVTPDTTYLFETNMDGLVEFELPAGIDIYEGTDELKIENATITIFPNPGSGFNYCTNLKLKGVIEIYNSNGERVLAKQVEGTHTFVDLSRQPNGVYVYVVKSNEGSVQTGKFVKTDLPRPPAPFPLSCRP